MKSNWSAKQISVLFFAGSWLLFLLALCFSEQRAINYDSAYYLFHVIQNKSFFVPNNRFTAALPQIPVMLAAKAGISIRSLLSVYSLSAAFISWIPAALFWVFGNYRWTIISLLTAFLFQAEGFFYPISDFRSGIPWLLGWSWLLIEHIKPGKVYLLLPLTLLLCAAAWSHPLSILPVLFVLGFWYYRQIRDVRFNSGVLLLHAAIICLRFATANTAYDGNKLHMPGWISFISDTPVSLSFYLQKDLLPEWILIIGILLSLRNKLLLLFFVLSTAGYLSLIQQTQSFTVYEQYTDHLLSGLALILSVVGGYSLFDKASGRIWVMLMLLMIGRSIQIAMNAENQNQRLNLYKQWISQCRQADISKAWVITDRFDFPNWDSFYQTILLSSSSGTPVAITWSKTPVDPNTTEASGSKWNDGNGSWNINSKNASPLPAPDSTTYRSAVYNDQTGLLQFTVSDTLNNRSE